MIVSDGLDEVVVHSEGLFQRRGYSLACRIVPNVKLLVGRHKIFRCHFRNAAHLLE